jgi:hypothetical protein
MHSGVCVCVMYVQRVCLYVQQEATHFVENWSEEKIARFFQDVKQEVLLSPATKTAILDYIRCLMQRKDAEGNFNLLYFHSHTCPRSAHTSCVYKLEQYNLNVS